MPTTKIPVEHSDVYGMTRAVPSYRAPATSWYTQFNLRRTEEGLVQVPVPMPRFGLNDADFLEIPAGVLPPKRKKIEVLLNLPTTYELKIKTTDVYSVSAWSTSEEMWNFGFVIKNSSGQIIGTSAIPTLLVREGWKSAVLETTLTHGTYTIEFITEVNPVLATVKLVIMSGPERVLEFVDTPVYESAIAFSATTDSLYFYTMVGNLPTLGVVNAYSGPARQATIHPWTTETILPVLVTTARGEVTTCAFDGIQTWLGIVGNRVNRYDVFNPGYIPAGGFLNPDDDRIYFWSDSSPEIVAFSMPNKSTQVYTNSWGDFTFRGPIRYYNHKIFQLVGGAVYELDSYLSYVQEFNGDEPYVDMCFVNNKYYMFKSTTADIYSSSLVFEQTITAYPPLFVNPNRKVIFSSFETQLPDLTFHTLHGLSAKTNDLTELHMVHPIVGPETGMYKPVACWIPELGRGVVLTGKAQGVRISFYA